MNQFLIAALIGLTAAILDVVPMIIQKLEKTANASAFLHYFVLGMIIPFIHWGIPGWLTGIIVSVLSSGSVMMIVLPKNKKAFVPMFVFAVVLGAGIGWAGTKFIG